MYPKSNMQNAKDIEYSLMDTSITSKKASPSPIKEINTSMLSENCKIEKNKVNYTSSSLSYGDFPLTNNTSAHNMISNIPLYPKDMALHHEADFINTALHSELDNQIPLYPEHKMEYLSKSNKSSNYNKLYAPNQSEIDFQNNNFEYDKLHSPLNRLYPDSFMNKNMNKTNLNKKMIKDCQFVFLIQFRCHKAFYECDNNDFLIEQFVIVEGDRGVDLGRILLIINVSTLLEANDKPIDSNLISFKRIRLYTI